MAKSTNRSRNDSDLCLRLPHNPEAVGSSPASATRKVLKSQDFRTFFALFRPITCSLFFLTQTLTQTGRGAESIRPHGRGYCPLFLPLHAWPRSLHERRRKRVTHSAFGEKSHTAAYTAKQGLFRMGGGIITLDTSCTFTNIPGPGIRTANFAALGSWPGVLSKNAESLRDSDALMRVAVPQASRPRWAA